MSVPIIFKDVNPYRYRITEDCKIYRDGEEIPIDDIIYHSTNGYDYVLLEQNHLENEEPKMKLYRLEFIMVSSFNPGLQNKWEWFKVTHLDGDIKNCKLDNLSWEEDVEEWLPVIHNRVMPNRYIVSSHGEIVSLYDRFNNQRKRTMSCHMTRNGYPQLSLLDIYGKVKHFRPHTIIAYSFYDGDAHIGEDVNHIDGDKLNNHYSNLEYVTRSSNIIHAKNLGLNKTIGETHPNSIMTEENVKYICELLIKTNGSIKDTTRLYNESRPDHILNSTIEHIKYKDTWRHVSDNYFEKGQFKY